MCNHLGLHSYHQCKGFIVWCQKTTTVELAQPNIHVGYLFCVDSHYNLCFPFQVTLQDTAGMERYASTLPPTYFRNCKVALFVYSVDNQESMDNIQHWVASINPIRIKGQTDEVCRAIVGTKIDLERVVSAERAMNVAEQLHIDQSLVFEVNALSGQGVQEMFNKIVRHIKTSSTLRETIDILNPQPDKKRCSC